MSRVLLICCSLLLATAQAEDSAALRFCYEDSDSYPWVMRGGEGLNIELLREVGEHLQRPIEFIAVPWRRCLAGLQQGRYDGAFAASYQAERALLGRYPLDAQGSVDSSRRLHTGDYALYHRVEQVPHWDGQRLQVNGPVGSLSGFSIVPFLHQLGARVDESSRDPQALLRVLASRRVSAVALQSARADFILQGDAQLAASIRKAPLPLQVKPYFLMLSAPLCDRDGELAERIWDSVRRVRESPGYQARERALHGLPDS